MGLWGDLTAVWVEAQAGWLLDGRIGQRCPELIGTSVGCHAYLSIVLFLCVLVYDVRFGGCGCLLWPALQRKSRREMLLLDQGVYVGWGLLLTIVKVHLG